MTHLAWVDALPKSWAAKPLRATADYVVSNVDKVPADDEVPVRLCNYTDVYNNEFITLALDFMQATATVTEIAKFGLAVDDVAITKDSESWDDIGVPALVRETAEDLVCGYHLALIRPRKQQMDGAFLFRCLQAKPVRVQLELAANGVTRFGIPKSDIGAMTLPVPPIAQQRAIADYLDRETARLDALVAAKERVLGLLAEKRRALITRAVTRGLDPRAPLRDSGIPWLGEVPAHWETLPLKRLVVRIESGVSVNAANCPAAAGEFGVLKTSAVFGGSFIAGENKSVVEAEVGRVACPVRADSVIMSRMNTPSLVGEIGYVDRDYQNLFLPDRLWQIGFDDRRVGTRFMASVMTSSGLRGVFSEMATGTSASMKNLGQEDILGVKVPLPPMDEQKQVVALITAYSKTEAVLIAATQRTIALLRERRAALIAAAVTGQVDVGSAE